MAAGAVLVTSLFAIIVGVIIFLPKIIELFFK
jgi:undecaprenol kinase